MSELKYLNLSDLKLDLYNPRLPKSKQGIDESIVVEYMLLEAATLELMEAIGENDFFAGEMLLVVPDINETAKYIVIEGNRRLTALKLLADYEITNVKKQATKEIYDNAKYRPSEIPCLVFETREEIQKYLGFVHITGKKSWRLLEKARYLQTVRKTNDSFKNLSFLSACKEIARIIGSNSAYVKKLLISYELYEIVSDEGFYQISDLNDTTFFLNYFTDGVQKENIRLYMNVKMDSENPLENIKKENLKELVTWWFKKTEGVSRVIGDSDGLKKLNAVLGNEVALNAFKNGMKIDEAYELTDDLDSQFEKKIKKALENMEYADRLSTKVKSFYSDLYDNLKDIRTIAKKINDFKSQREEDKDDF